MSMEQFINAIIDREEMENDDDDYYYDDDDDGNMPCDYSGLCAGSSCPAFLEVSRKILKKGGMRMIDFLYGMVWGMIVLIIIQEICNRKKRK